VCLFVRSFVRFFMSSFAHPLACRDRRQHNIMDLGQPARPCFTLKTHGQSAVSSQKNTHRGVLNKLAEKMDLIVSSKISSWSSSKLSSYSIRSCLCHSCVCAFVCVSVRAFICAFLHVFLRPLIRSQRSLRNIMDHGQPAQPCFTLNTVQ